MRRSGWHGFAYTKKGRKRRQPPSARLRAAGNHRFPAEKAEGGRFELPTRRMTGNGFRDILILARLSQIGQVSASWCARTPLTGTIGAVHVASLEEGRRWFEEHRSREHPNTLGAGKGASP